MRLTELLMRRTRWIVTVYLLVAFAFSAWRASLDVQRESDGDRSAAALTEALLALRQQPASSLPDVYSTLNRLNGDGQLRHLRVRVTDAEGRELVGQRSGVEGGIGRPLMARLLDDRLHDARRFPVRRNDGTMLWVTLQADPHGVRSEALWDMGTQLAMLLLFGAALLLTMHRIVRRSFVPLQSLLDGISDIERGVPLRTFPDAEIDELKKLGAALNHLSRSLLSSESMRHEIATRLQALQEEERANLARDLHDEFGLRMTAMRVSLHWLERVLESSATDGSVAVDSATLQSVVAKLDQDCEVLQHGMQHLITRLRPEVQHGVGDRFDIVVALWDLVSGWQSRSVDKIRFSLDISPELSQRPLRADLAITLYRITQEALINAVRHADASHIVIRIKVESQGLRWQVFDNGRGIGETGGEGDQMRNGNGLKGLRERVWAQGGKLLVSEWPETPERRGCCLTAWLSLELSKEGGK